METNREILDRYVELYNAGDLDACMKLYAKDAEQRMHDGIFEGVDAIRRRLARDLKAFPDAKYVVDRFFAQGDEFADEWTFTGTNTGPLRLPDGTEIPPTGKPVEIKGMEYVKVRDGKIVVDNLYYDFLAAVVQIGLVPQGNGGVAREFEVTARMKIRDGELDGFREHAAEIMRLARERDTKTLRYDWFVSDDGTECEVREGYVDADGLLDHNTHVREARDELFRDHAYGHDMTIYDEPSPALAELIDRMAGHARFNRFSFLQGLDDSQPTALAGDTEGGTAIFEATALLKIREGKLEAFKQQAAEILHQMSQADEQPLRYDWFLSDDGTECEVREAYVNADALLAHQQQVAEAKKRLFHECIESHTMTFYSEPSPALAGALQAMGATYTTFSFLQGLNVDINVLEEVPA